MASIIKVDTIQDQDGNNIINETANTITIGASGDTITIPSGATLANSGIVTGFQSTGIDDNATSTAITINSSNNVGVGTSSPANYFNYNTVTLGEGGIGSILQLDGASSGHYHLVQNNNGSMIISADQGNVVGSTTMNFLTDGSERMRISSTGHVGINTTAPVSGLANFSQLTISGGEGGIVINSNDTAVNDYGRLVFTIGNSTGNEGLIRYNTNDYHMSFWTNASERMRIDNSGNVGIGTSSPNALLDLGGAGSSYQSGQEKITIAQAPNPYIYYPSLSSHNRSYLHLTGSGGGSGFNTSIHGYQVDNPAGNSYMRVASGLTNNYVFYHKTDVTGFKWYADYNKSSGDADFTPSTEVAFNFETDTGAIVFNESSRDRDFRVESNNQSHMLVVDGGQDAVAIGSGDIHQAAKLNVTQLDGNKPIQHLRGDEVVGGQIRSMKILRHVPVVSLGTKLIIPFISQSSFNTSSLITLRGKTAIYNTSIPKAFEVVFAIGHLTSLSNFSVLRSGGTYSSATTNGMNVEITFNTNYTSATEDGVMIEMDILCERMQFSVDIDAIVMN